MKARYFAFILVGILFLYLVGFFIYDDYFSREISLSPLKPESAETCNKYSDTDKSVVRILVIDGGGIDGIIPLVLLEYLEKQTGKPVSELFDFFTGTSTGSIIVSILNIHNKYGEPVYSASDVKNLYLNVSKDILNPSITRRVMTMNGIFSPHLSIENLNRGLKLILNKDNVTYGNLQNRVSITAFNLGDKKLQLFNSWECAKPVSRYLVSDIITAAVATPAILAPVVLKDYDNGKSKTYVDGMIFDNNPSLVAINKAFSMYPRAKKFIIVHLGTGGDSLNYVNLRGDRKQAWGLARWIFPMLSILYRSQNSSIQHAIRGIQHFTTDTDFDYTYYNKNLKHASPFDTSPENIEDVLTTGNELLQEQKKELDRVAHDLVTQ